MAHTVLAINPGDSINLVLPSGTMLSVECTADTFDIIDRTGRTLFSEEKGEDDKRWREVWPAQE